ncbi:MAG: hypothetical protein COA38_10140 [Fluviicola sp.]|nr:MAG: hypothetical protein COA38_10140 [Fluviicola sp.]
MFKIRIISLSILLLLLVGVDMNVRAGIDSSDSIQRETDKEQSDKEPQQRESDVTISQLDFFGAFSLVNTQLQWRDYHIALNDEGADVELSTNPKELFLNKIDILPLELEGQIVPTSPIINTGDAIILVSTYRTLDGTSDFICSQNKQSASTIAYIQNCGTYPLSS